MRFAFTDEQLEFRDGLRALLEKECTPSHLRDAWTNETGRVPGLWEQLVDMGVVALLAPEADGGLGLTFVDLVLLLEETGRHAVPEPIVETAAIGVPLLRATGTVAAGEELVPWADTADVIVTAAGRFDRATAALTPHASVDGARRLFTVLGTGAEIDFDAVFVRGALGTAAQQCGLADRMIELTVGYVKERQQFGVPVGSFQAVKHHLANARLALEFARPLVYRAAVTLDPAHVSMAKAKADGAALTAARVSLQCHGAIGCTHEYALPEAYIVDAVRAPVGRRNGGLAQVHPADLGAHSIRALMDRVDVDPAAVEDVVFGCVDTIGPQAGDIARTCWLVAGLPDEVPGTTVDRQCGSSQQAVHFAAQAVMAGVNDLVVAGGVQNMSAIPITAAMLAGEPFGFENPFSGSPGWEARYGTQEVSQFRSAEMIAEKWDITRDDMEAFAIESHERALRAIAEGRFEREIVPLAGVQHDEGPREPDVDKIRSLRTLVEGGRLTAAVSSQISDGSAALLIASEQAVKAHGLQPRARIHHMSVRGADPVWMLTAPIPATAYAMEKTGMTLDEIDLVEINEAFASVVLAWQKETGADLAKVNVNGGAIALGHPLGATGARLMTTLLHELERTGGRYGLQTMCEGGGQANVTIIERL